MNQVVMLSYYYPPVVGIASERSTGFHRHLPEFGWNSVVVAPRAAHFHQLRDGEGSEPDDTLRTPNPELSRFLRRRYAGSTGARVEVEGVVEPLDAGRVGRVLRRVVREYLYVPDAQVGWIPFARGAARRALRASRADRRALFSTSVPYSAHLAAARVAHGESVPWVAEFRDPWSTNDPSFLPRSALRRRIDRILEGRILRRADHIVVTAPQGRDLILAGFPEVGEEHISVITNGFEPVERGSPPGPGEPLRLMHAGTLSDPECARPLIDALRRIGEERPGEIQLAHLGSTGSWRALMEDAGEAYPWLELGGVMPPRETREAMTRASALVVLLPDSRYDAVISGKLLSYLGARRPILGGVPEGSVMEEYVERFGQGWLAHPWQAERIREVLLALLDEHRAGRLQAPTVSEERVEPLTRRALARALARILDRVTEDRR